MLSARARYWRVLPLASGISWFSSLSEWTCIKRMDSAVGNAPILERGFVVSTTVAQLSKLFVRVIFWLFVVP